MTMHRRRFTGALTCAAAAMLVPRGPALAAPQTPGGKPAPKLTRTQRKLRNRLELWSTFAARTRNLRARYTLTRATSLLRDPLVVSGTLAFVSPDTLVLHDDAKTGCVTRIVGSRVTIEPNDPALPGRDGGELDAGRDRGRALAWYRARLLGLFTPPSKTPDDDRSGDGDLPFPIPAFARRCQLEIPKGGGMQLLLQAPAGDPVGRVIRSFRVRLDPTTGAVFVVESVETRGDRVVLELSDHRQNVDAVLLEEFLRPRER